MLLRVLSLNALYAVNFWSLICALFCLCDASWCHMMHNPWSQTVKPNFSNDFSRIFSLHSMMIKVKVAWDKPLWQSGPGSFSRQADLRCNVNCILFRLPNFTWIKLLVLWNFYTLWFRYFVARPVQSEGGPTDSCTDFLYYTGENLILRDERT